MLQILRHRLTNYTSLIIFGFSELLFLSCQDGWFKGTSNRTQKCGVFPGNYVTLARGAPNLQSSSSKDGTGDSKLPVSFTRSGKGVSSSRTACNPPELPPRSISPATTGNTISSSWHGQQDNAAVPLGRSSSAIMSSVNNAHLTVGSATVAKASDKVCLTFLIVAFIILMVLLVATTVS